ncbi:MAG: helix-turn-helix domain-containing protein [Acidobacteriia bacterium]|nr:helix-turn-helix domain-containing protein [Terriglobia bacterium]
MKHRTPRGFKRIPAWMFHSRLPVDAETRLITSYLLTSGSANHPTVSELSDALCMDAKTVRRNVYKLEELGLLKVIRRAK